MGNSNFRIDKVSITISQDTIFDKESQKLEASVVFNDDYPYLSIKTDRWVCFEPLDEITDKIMSEATSLESNLYKELNKTEK